MTMAVLLSHANQHDSAMQWLAYALAASPDDIIGEVRTHPALAALRKAKPSAFIDLSTVKYEWNVAWGILNDDIVLTNKSAFPMTNIVFRPTINNAGKVFTAQLKLSRLNPGESHKFVDAIAVTGSKYDNTTSTLACDQSAR
jgi:hypothetical protein